MWGIQQTPFLLPADACPSAAVLLFCCVWRPRKQRKKQEADYVQKYFENVNKGEPYPNNAAPAAAGEGWHIMLACEPVQLRLAVASFVRPCCLGWRPSSSIFAEKGEAPSQRHLQSDSGLPSPSQPLSRGLCMTSTPCSDQSAAALHTEAQHPARSASITSMAAAC